MAASPTCEVKDGAGAYTATTDGFNTTPAGTTTIRLVSTAGVDSWSISCVGTDDLRLAATINAGLTIDGVLKTCTFTAPLAGSALIFRSVVVDVNGVVATTTCGIYTLTAGSRRVGAVGETTEGSAAFGWVKWINDVIRNPSGGAGTPGGSPGDVQVNTAGALAGVSPGPSGNLLKSNGSAWTSGAPSSPAEVFSILWRPGGSPSSADHVTTWAEVEAWITATNTASPHSLLTVLVDDSITGACTVPGSADTDLLGLVRFVNASGYLSASVVIADGGRIRNPAGVDDVFFYAAPTAVIPIYFDQFLRFESRGALGGFQLAVGASTSMISGSEDVVLRSLGVLRLVNDSAEPLVLLETGRLFELSLFGGVAISAFVDDAPSIPALLVGGGGTEFFQFNEGITPYTAQSAFTGTVTIGRSLSTHFDEATPGTNWNLVANTPEWTGVPGELTRALTDNTKIGNVNLAFDTNDEVESQDAFGCTGNFGFAGGNLPSVTDDYGFAFGYRPNARGYGSGAIGISVFGDGRGSFAVGEKTVAGSLVFATAGTTVTFDQSSRTIVRSSGDWTTESSGFWAEMMFSVIGSALNDISQEEIESVTTDTITLVNDVLTDEVAVVPTFMIGQNDYGMSSGRTVEARAKFGFIHGYLGIVSPSAKFGVNFGYNCANGPLAKWSLAGGNQSQAKGPGCIAWGNSEAGPGEYNSAFGVAITTGDNAHGRGYLPHAGGSGSIADGQFCVADVPHTYSCGFGAESLNYGEWSHASNAYNMPHKGRHEVDGWVRAVAAPAIVVLGNGGDEIVLENNTVYSVEYTLLATKVGADVHACEVRLLVVKVIGGTLTITRNTLKSDALELVSVNGWSATISAFGLNLRTAVDPAADTVDFYTTSKWTAGEHEA